MANQEQTSGLALLCDQTGLIEEILYDKIGAADQALPGQPWTVILDPGSLEKGLNFMVALRQQDMVYDWEMNVSWADGVTSLHFVGATFNQQLLIVGAKTSNGVKQLYEQMMQMNNEHINALRAAIKETSERTRTQVERSNALYEQITRLNNQLVAMQRELARKNAELERLNQQKNHFLGIAAHDLRNPLSAILAYSEFLLADLSDQLDEEQVEFLNVIHSSSQFMSQLINDLLDVAKIESGKLDLDLEPTDLGDLVTANVNLNRRLARDKEIELRLALEDVLTVLVDRAKIEQVLNNLISNAIKYSPSGAVVDVRLSRQGDQVQLSVQDRGQGIPSEEMDKLFKPFSRTSVQTTGGETSTGLGLVIVKKIVDGHGGQINVESGVGEGTTFHVRLPLQHGGQA
jgi:signal transduction histidine kinase